MATNTQITNAIASAQADLTLANLNNGYLRLYSGTQPADANTALSGNTLLAELRFNATAFTAAVNGVATANSLTSDTDADNTGTATFARCLKSDGTTVVFDCSVGVSGCDINLTTAAIIQHGVVQITSFTWTQRKNSC